MNDQNWWQGEGEGVDGYFARRPDTQAIWGERKKLARQPNARSTDKWPLVKNLVSWRGKISRRAIDREEKDGKERGKKKTFFVYDQKHD